MHTIFTDAFGAKTDIDTSTSEVPERTKQGTATKNTSVNITKEAAKGADNGENIFVFTF
jgi:hypothetical protein